MKGHRYAHRVYRRSGTADRRALSVHRGTGSCCYTNCELNLKNSGFTIDLIFDSNDSNVGGKTETRAKPSTLCWSELQSLSRSSRCFTTCRKAGSLPVGLSRWMVAQPLVCFWTCSIRQLMWMQLLSHLSCAIRDGCCVGVGPGCFGSVLPISSLVQSGRSVLALRSPSPSTPRT